MNIKKEYEKFFERKKNDLCVHDAEDVITFAEHYQALQLQQADVISSACNDYIDGINMQCARCDEPKYKHKF